MQFRGGEQLHESTVLTYTEAGRNRFATLSPARVAAVLAAPERYRTARANLEVAIDPGRVGVVSALSARRGTRRVRSSRPWPGATVLA